MVILSPKRNTQDQQNSDIPNRESILPSIFIPLGSEWIGQSADLSPTTWPDNRFIQLTCERIYRLPLGGWLSGAKRMVGL